jgi:Tfp pilus assembly protein PilX
MTTRSNQQGSILLVFLITLPFLILMAMFYMKLSLTSFQVARTDHYRTEAQLAADAGADHAVQQLTQDDDWVGTTGEQTLYSDSKIRTTYQSTVTSGTNAKTIAVTGRTYFPATAATPIRSVSVNIDMRPVTAGIFSIVSGEGGLYMSNSSKITGGDVFVNGEVNLTNNAQIGLSTNPVNLKVADQACPVPPDATYPRVCGPNEGPQPISINNNGIIYGRVTATNQTDGSRMQSPGLVAGTVAPQALPTYDRDAHEAAVATTLTASSASCTTNNGTRNWPANTKITGNVTIENNCKVTINGNVWITGSLTMNQSGQIIVANGVGSTRPVVMVDGTSGFVMNNSSQLLANNVGTGLQMITYWSAAACSPDCASVTGVDLYNSRGVTTISLQNNGTAPNSIFYAYWSQVTVGNSGQIGALIGQTIRLTNNGTITFGTSVNTGTTTWVVKGYRRQ